jgi:hypothetical protein
MQAVGFSEMFLKTPVQFHEVHEDPKVSKLVFDRASGALDGLHKDVVDSIHVTLPLAEPDKAPVVVFFNGWQVSTHESTLARARLALLLWLCESQILCAGSCRVVHAHHQQDLFPRLRVCAVRQPYQRTVGEGA